jgi:hypothetical protein
VPGGGNAAAFRFIPKPFILTYFDYVNSQAQSIPGEDLRNAAHGYKDFLGLGLAMSTTPTTGVHWRFKFVYVPICAADSVSIAALTSSERVRPSGLCQISCLAFRLEYRIISLLR